MAGDGDLDDAQRVAEEALAVSRSVGLRGWASTMTTQLGDLALARGDVDGAVSLHNEAVQIAGELALPTVAEAALEHLSAALAHQDDR